MHLPARFGFFNRRKQGKFLFQDLVFKSALKDVKLQLDYCNSRDLDFLDATKAVFANILLRMEDATNSGRYSSNRFGLEF